MRPLIPLPQQVLGNTHISIPSESRLDSQSIVRMRRLLPPVAPRNPKAQHSEIAEVADNDGQQLTASRGRGGNAEASQEAGILDVPVDVARNTELRLYPLDERLEPQPLLPSPELRRCLQERRIDTTEPSPKKVSVHQAQMSSARGHHIDAAVPD